MEGEFASGLLTLELSEQDVRILRTALNLTESDRVAERLDDVDELAVTEVVQGIVNLLEEEE